MTFKTFKTREEHIEAFRKMINQRHGYETHIRQKIAEMDIVQLSNLSTK